MANVNTPTFGNISPLYNQGIVPTGAFADELSAVTRRAFVPAMIVQLYKSTPLLSTLLANRKTASGGVSQVSLPVQGASFVNFEWSGYNGAFSQPSQQRGAYLGQWNLKLGVVPVPFLGMEGVMQLDHSIIPLVEARMNDATAVTRDQLATSLFTSLSGGAPITNAITGLDQAIDDNTNVQFYAGIDRSANTWWKAQRIAGGNTTLTRALCAQFINQLTKQTGEAPTMGVTDFSTWQGLLADFVGQERYIMGEDPKESGAAGFRALMVSGVPIYPDPYMPSTVGAGGGTLYLLNTDYLDMYIHQNVSFSFTGFQSTLPNFQLGFVGAVCTLLELVCAKPKVNAIVTGLTTTF